jgi:hypothetical protein
VRAVGEDMQAGEALLLVGHRLRPWTLPRSRPVSAGHIPGDGRRQRRRLTSTQLQVA